MDRQSLLAEVPHDLRALNGPGQHAAVLGFVEKILNAIGVDGAEPDAWEGPDLAFALGHVLMGWYSAALTLAVRSITAPAQRAPGSDGPAGESPMTLRVLRDRLDTLRQIGHRHA